MYQVNTDWQPRTWGRTRQIARGFGFDFWECEAVKGGFSSLHRHRSKDNDFMLVSGSLMIRAFHATGAVTHFLVQPGQRISIPQRVPHQFEALEECRFYEWYGNDATHHIVADDIERWSANGVRTSAQPASPHAAEPSREVETTHRQ